ncbi:signal peptidase I [Candidatus Parcubacteria bacterium]|nr:signal peptidase I [Candidatus Parcubacteria bacterium]
MDPMENSSKTSTSFWKELLKLVAIAAIVVIPFRLYIAQPFIVDGASMDPTFETGQYLIVDEVTYRFHPPVRGSVLIFKYPKDPSKYFIKRLIGLPGETVTIENGVVTIVEPNKETLTLDEPYVKLAKSETSTYRELGPDEYFVMGDNRAGSADSRFWGPVPKKNIIGRPILRVWPFSLLPGNINESH